MDPILINLIRGLIVHVGSYFRMQLGTLLGFEILQGGILDRDFSLALLTDGVCGLAFYFAFCTYCLVPVVWRTESGGYLWYSTV